MDANNAQDQLRLIAQAQKMEKQIGQPEAGWLWLIWGMVWLVGFLLSQYAPTAWLLWIWLGLCTVGAAGSALIGLRLGQQVQYAQSGPKLAWLYVASLSFCPFWLLLAQPQSWQQTAVLAITFLGFTITISGILLQTRQLLLIGSGMMLLTTAVYLILPAQFGLLLGLIGGGSMLLMGQQLIHKGHHGPA